MYTFSLITQSDRVLRRPCKRWEDAVLSYRPNADWVDINDIDGGGDDDSDEQMQVSS